jgi:hypothetical protein
MTLGEPYNKAEPEVFMSRMKSLDTLPRGHAYIRMRNDGATMHIDYPDVDSAEAARMIQAIMDIFKESLEKASAKPHHEAHEAES